MAFKNFVKRGSYCKKLSHLEEVYGNINTGLKMNLGVEEISADTFISYLYYYIVISNPKNIIASIKLLNTQLLCENRNDIFGHMLNDMELCTLDLLFNNLIKTNKDTSGEILRNINELETKYIMHLFTFEIEEKRNKTSTYNVGNVDFYL